ncbi:MAG TPA: dihydrofolate reductase family protein [Vicinamibacterales bacterium]|nr:dihydrofolate reductase family protein [Vicinamibacterales bacterium]
MSKLRFKISMSLDGFVAGPNQSVDNPLGVGGLRLHEWVFPLAAWRALHGLEGGEVNESTPIIEESLANVGATVMGRNMFGGHPGPWNGSTPWAGWWGTNPPFHHSVFVVTHHPREPLELDGGTTFTFVTDGIEAAFEQARRAAGGKDVSLGGGANVARQYLLAGLVDEMEISLVPTLLGSGERLLDGVDSPVRGLELVRTVSAPGVTHLRFVRTRTP